MIYLYSLNTAETMETTQAVTARSAAAQCGYAVLHYDNKCIIISSPTPLPGLTQIADCNERLYFVPELGEGLELVLECENKVLVKSAIRATKQAV